MERVQHSIVLPAATVVAAEPQSNIPVTSDETIIHVRLARIAGRHFSVDEGFCRMHVLPFQTRLADYAKLQGKAMLPLASFAPTLPFCSVEVI